MSREVRLSDRVKQLSFDPSTNAFSLDSIATGFSPFRDFYEDGDVVFYAATDGTRYEVGSGEYSSNSLTRYPLRSSNISSGPYFVDDASSYGSTAGQEGHFYPLYLTKSAASGVRGFAGVAQSVHEHRFSGYPGVTFYMPNTHAGHAVPAYHAGVSGENYAVSGGPVDFQGVTEVFITYPGKSAVFNGAGVSGFNDVQPQKAGIAFWGNEQTLDYDADIVWSTGQNAIGVSQPSPEFAIDVGGLVSYSQIRSSGFIDGGSGVQFSGGQALPQSALKTASGGRQLEPFFRNELDTQTHTDQVFSLSGLVDQRLLFKKQLKGQILAGPPSGCDESSATCPEDHPLFRYLQLEDIPDLSSLYVVQQNYVDYDSDIPTGAVAFTSASGKIEFDKYLKYEKSNNWLGVNIPIAPSYSLDVGGDAGISGMLMVSGDAHFGGDIHAVGNLLVSGTKTFLDSTIVTMKDINLELASQSGDAINNDAAIDDAGIIVKSTNYDKKWTWKNATDAWTTTEKIDVSGIIFNGDASNSISGAYQGGSGITISNIANGHLIDVGNIFYASGTDSAGNTEHLLHHSDRLLVSGVSGIQTRVFGFSGPSGLLEINATSLQNNVYDKIDASGNKVSGVLTAADTYLSNRMIADSGYAEFFARASGNSAIAVASGWTNSVSGYVDAKVGSIGGGYGQWKVSASGGSNYTLHRSQNISSNNSVHFMGVSGVVADYSDTTKEFRFAAPGLSGDIMQHITNSGNRSIADASGWTNSVSGYFDTRIGGLGGGYGHWKVSASGGANNSTHISDEVATTNSVHFMGVSGLVADYTASSNIFRFAAPGLSGDLLNHITNSGNKALKDASGVAISASGALKLRIDTLAIGAGSGVFAGSGLVKTNVGDDISLHLDFPSGLSDVLNLAVSSGNRAVQVASGLATGGITSYGSGIALQDGTVDFRHDGSGTLRHLIFDQAIRVGNGAGVGSISGADESVIIGLEAASGQLNGFQTSGTFIGYRAGYQASGQQNSIFIGPKAGMGAIPFSGVEVYNNIGIGENAARASLRSSQLISIGYNSSLYSSGITNLVAIGQGAAGAATNTLDCISIGYNAGNASSEQEYAIFIGKDTARDSWNTIDSLFIGRSAGKLSSGGDGYAASNNIGIGDHALFATSGEIRVQAFGDGAGQRGNRNQNCNLFGYQAMYSGVQNAICDFVGYGAGTESQSNQNSLFFGLNTGFRAKDNFGTVSIGNYASQSGYSDDRSVYIGYYAGRYGDNNEKNVAVGYYALGGLPSLRGTNDRVIAIGSAAGTKASGVQNSVIIGRNAMNYMDDIPSEVVENTIVLGRAVGKGNNADRKIGSYNLIIEPTCHQNSRHKEWAADYDPYIISIGSVIHGYSTAAVNADGSSQRNLMIGRQPSNQSELTSCTLTVKPDRAVDHVLKLDRQSAQAGDILRVDVNNVGSSFGTGRTEQTIVDSDGYLKIPIAKYKDSAGNVYDNTGNKIPTNEGTFAIWSPAAGQTPSQRYYIIYIDGDWRRQVAEVIPL